MSSRHGLATSEPKAPTGSGTLSRRWIRNATTEATGDDALGRRRHGLERHGLGSGVVGGLLMLIVLALAAVDVVALVRASRDRSLTFDRQGPDPILDERFARGEIDIEEYTRRRDLLRSTR
jgi:putative membrane protein